MNYPNDTKITLANRHPGTVLKRHIWRMIHSAKLFLVESGHLSKIFSIDLGQLQTASETLEQGRLWVYIRAEGHTRDEGPIEGALQVKNFFFFFRRHTSGRIKGWHLSCNMSLAIHDVRRAGRLAITRMNRCANSLLCEHKHAPRQCHWKCDFHNRAGNEARGRNLARQSRGFNLQHPLEDSISHSKWAAKPLHFGFIQQENLVAMDKCDDRNTQACRNDHQCLSYNIPLFT